MGLGLASWSTGGSSAPITSPSVVNALVTSNIVTNSIQITVGSSTAVGLVASAIHTNVTAVGNAADTSEDTLMSYSLAANCLVDDGKSLRLTAWGNASAGAATRTLRFYWGSNKLFDVSLAASALWRCDIDIFRTGASAQQVSGQLLRTAVTPDPIGSAGTQTLSGAVLIKATGQSSSGLANSINQLGLFIESFN